MSKQCWLLIELEDIRVDTIAIDFIYYKTMLMNVVFRMAIEIFIKDLGDWVFDLELVAVEVTAELES